ncbi:MAG TPA: thiamine-phosphate synthase [archaeon]|nr:thiamine-phosphate synthase [archaeon]
MMDNIKPLDAGITEEKLKLIKQIKEIYNFIQLKQFCKLIPEVRSNIAGALRNASTREEVAGIDGRITIVNGMPKAAGEIRFGVAEHTARLVLTAKEFDNSITFVMNLKYSPELIQGIQSKTDLTLKEIQRENQPAEIKKKEFSTMQWLIKESLDEDGRIPDIIWDKGSIGKEPMIRLFGMDSVDIIKKLAKIFKIL